MELRRPALGSSHSTRVCMKNPEFYIPPYKVSGKAMNLIAEIAAAVERYRIILEDPVLVKSCVFHYEFEFIHPFPDGNGRTGRLWQTALLGSWRKEFYGAPVENIVWAHQQEYYQAIRASSAAGECGPFIDFMLDKILRTLKAKGEAYESAGAETDKKTIKKTIKKTDKKTDRKILSIMKSMPDVTLAELANATGLSVAGVRWNVRKLKDANLLRRIGPDKGGHWEVV